MKISINCYIIFSIVLVLAGCVGIQQQSQDPSKEPNLQDPELDSTCRRLALLQESTNVA